MALEPLRTLSQGKSGEHIITDSRWSNPWMANEGNKYVKNGSSRKEIINVDDQWEWMSMTLGIKTATQ